MSNITEILITKYQILNIIQNFINGYSDITPLIQNFVNFYSYYINVSPLKIYISNSTIQKQIYESFYSRNFKNINASNSKIMHRHNENGVLLSFMLHLFNKDIHESI